MILSDFPLQLWNNYKTDKGPRDWPRGVSSAVYHKGAQAEEGAQQVYSNFLFHSTLKLIRYLLLLQRLMINTSFSNMQSYYY